MGATLQPADGGPFSRHGLDDEYAPGKARTGFWHGSRESEDDLGTLKPAKGHGEDRLAARERLEVDEVDESMRTRR